MISEHFARSEFSCKCGCGFDTVDAQLLKNLEAIRNHFDRAVIINSGCRCEAYNREVGGAEATNGSEGSQHLYGRAADIVVKGVPAELVQELCEQMGVPGIGKYQTFTHLDTRSGYARW